MDSYMPKYIEIENFIIEKIKSGSYKTGMKIPSENEISEKFNVSRVTANKAISELANQGIVERIQGKGTYVSSSSSLISELYHNTGKSVKISSEIAESRSHKVQNVELMVGDEYLRNKFDLSKKENKIFKINRLMVRDDSTIAIDNSFIPAKYLNENPDFKILEKSYLHEFIGHYKKTKGFYLHVHIDAKLPNNSEIEILNVKKDEPLVIWDTNVLDENKKIIAFTTSIAHPKKYRAYINFKL